MRVRPEDKVTHAHRHTRAHTDTHTHTCAYKTFRTYILHTNDCHLKHAVVKFDEVPFEFVSKPI